MSEAVWTEALTILSVVIAATVVINQWRARLRERTKDLRITAKVLSDHYDAVERFVSDPAAPQHLKEALLGLTEAISTREVACRIAPAFADGSLLEGDDSSVVFIRDLKQLRSHREDLANDFSQAVGAGTVALFLRWPETAKTFKQMMADIATDQRKEVSLAAHIGQLTGKLKNGHLGSGGGQPAPA